MSDLSNTELAQRCRDAQRKREHGSPYCLELITRACDRDQGAEQELLQLVTNLAGWVLYKGMSSQDVAVEAYARWWKQRLGRESLPPEKEFGILIVCINSVYLDNVRSDQRWTSRNSDLKDEHNNLFSLEEFSERQEVLKEIQKIIEEMTKENQLERIVLFESFAEDKKPSEIFEQHPDLFESVARVSDIKQNILKRIRRNPLIRKILGKDFGEKDVLDGSKKDS